MDFASLPKTIGATIQKNRKAQGLTQKQLASQAGVSERLLRSLEMGLANGVGLEKLAAILNALGLKLEVTSATSDGVSRRYSPTRQGPEYSDALKRTIAEWTN